MNILSRVFSSALAGTAALAFSSAAFAGPPYEDVPNGGYAYVAPSPLIYGYAAAPRGRVYGYGPAYRYGPAIVVPTYDDQNRALGTYVPNDGQNLSPPRRYFGGVERQAGGE